MKISWKNSVENSSVFRLVTAYSEAKIRFFFLKLEIIGAIFPSPGKLTLRHRRHNLSFYF